MSGSLSALARAPVSLNKDLKEPEVHIIGEIVGASDLETDNAFCVFQVKTGRYWSCVGGDEQGQTQVDYPSSETDDMVIWNHPIDLHYYTKSVEGWPKLIFEVWHLDEFGGKVLSGYSFINVPTSSGAHELETGIWRPCGTHREEMAHFFTGDGPHLLNPDILHNPVKAKEDRHRLTTKHVGKIHLRLDVIVRYFAGHSVDQ